jgi:hypothetical protein
MRWPALVVVALCGIGLSGCTLAAFVPEHEEAPPAPVTLTVEIDGTPGLAFEGSVGTPASSRRIEGTVPAEYTITTAIGVAVSATKEGEDGELSVRVVRGGTEVSRRQTSAPYGTVLLVYKP